MSDSKSADNQHGGKPALRGDLTQGPILRTLIAFTIPTLAANVLQTLGGTVNTIWVGQLLGEKAVAATATANMVMFLAFAAVFGFGMAATIKVGQYCGQHNIDNARRVFGAGTGFCFVVSVAGTLTGWFGAGSLLDLLATPASFHDDALAYIRFSFVGMPFGTVSMMIAMSLRGAGDARSPLYAMILTTLLGIALNPLLILGWGPLPAMGIAGSALANALATVIGMAALIGWMYWQDLPLRLRGREWAYLLPVGPDMRYIIAKGLPMGAQMLLSTAAGVIMVGLVNREGMLTSAAYGAVLQIWNYIQMPSFAISTAVSAIVAQNIGAAQHARVGHVTWVGVIVNTGVTSMLTVALMAFDRPLLALFLGAGSAAIPLAEHMQVLSTWGWVLSGVMMILIGTMRAYGAVLLPLLIMFVSQYPARLGFYEVLYPVIGPDALWWSYPFGGVIAVLLTWAAYAKGGWRKLQLLPAPSNAPANA